MVARKLRHYFGDHKMVVLTSYPIKNVLGKIDESSHLSQIGTDLSEFKIQNRSLCMIKEQALIDFIVEWTYEPIVELEAQLSVLVVVVSTLNL